MLGAVANLCERGWIWMVVRGTACGFIVETLSPLYFKRQSFPPDHGLRRARAVSAEGRRRCLAGASATGLWTRGIEPGPPQSAGWLSTD